MVAVHSDDTAVAACRSAVLLRMGNDTISAAEFMQLIKDESTATGLTDKREYNAFLVMPARGDKLAELVFRVASSTQVGRTPGLIRTCQHCLVVRYCCAALRVSRFQPCHS